MICVKFVEKNSSPQINDIKIIAIYSAKKIITNKLELYSVLNPETNSLSPSAKSKGDRFDSASKVTVSIRNEKEITNARNLCFSIFLSQL